MQVHIDRNGERYGPYSIEEINAYLANGTLLPTDLAWQDGMTDWLPVSQISGVVMPGGSVATSIPPSQPVPNGNKKKILIGIGAGMGLLALMAGIWFFFIREAGDKEQLSNNNGSNSTTAKPVKELTTGKVRMGSFEYFKAEAEKGDSDCQNNLGAMYAKGQEVEKDYKEAAKWYRKAAEQNNPVAQLNLGRAYINAQGVEKDRKEAIKWFRAAAEQGFFKAQWSLGVAYDYGTGVVRDNVTAFAWYTLAIANGDVKSKKHKTDLAKKMIPEQIAEGEALIKEMIQKNPKLMNKDAIFNRLPK